VVIAQLSHCRQVTLLSDEVNHKVLKLAYAVHARDCVRREGEGGHAHPQIGRNYLLSNSLGNGSFKLGCRDKSVVKREVPDFRCLKIGEQLQYSAFLTLLTKTINETRAQWQAQTREWA